MKKIFYILNAALLLYLLQPAGGTFFYRVNARYIYVLLLSFSMVYAFMPVAIRAGIHYGLLDYPNERKIHSKPVPITGGLAIFAAYSLTLMRNFNFSPMLKGIMMGSFILFITGIVDDIRPLPASFKLLLQVIATSVLILYGIRVTVFPFSMPFKHVLDILVTYIGVVGITNAFNYMDGMNGEAGGLAFITVVTFFLISLGSVYRHISWASIALAGCCLGFLPYNFPRARAFLGDNGSTVIGFLLAAIAIAGSWNADNTAVAVATPLLIFSLYIFDMAYTTVSRIKNGTVKTVKEWFEVTGKDHLHHRLVNLGFSKAQAVIIIWVTAAIFCFSAYVIRSSGAINAVLIMAQALFIYFLIIVLMLAGRENNINTDERRT